MWRRLQSWLRGEQYFPAGTRGRIHQSRGRINRRRSMWQRLWSWLGGGIEVSSKGASSIVPSRVYRAAEDKWYQVDPATGALTMEEDNG